MSLLGKRLDITFLFIFIISMGVLITIGGFKHFFPYTNPSLFLLGKEAHFDIYLPALYGHIATSGIILVVGFLGFLESIRVQKIHWHRWLGKAYIVLILFVSAPCGLVMGWYATGGWAVQLCFLLLSGLWWWFTFQAWKRVRLGDIAQHRAYMVRSYALTLSAVMLRWYSFILAFFWNLHGPEVYVWMAWASWVPNLVLAEIYLRFENLRMKNFQRS